MPSNKVCEICGEKLGVVDPLLIEAPYSGRDFASVDPAHGVPPPFHAILTWEHMRCPYGPHRPFTSPDRLLLDTGNYLELSGRVSLPPSPAQDGDGAPGLPGPVEPAPSTLTCPHCGKECGSQIGLVSHMKRKHKE